MPSAACLIGATPRLARLVFASLMLASTACTRDAAKGQQDLGGGDGSANTDGNAHDFGTIDPSCAEVTQQAKLNRVDLVVLLDRSGSMGDGINGDATKKWNPVTSALETFFADPKSKGLRASLEFFPADNDLCNSSTYYFPATGMTPLPSGAFGTAIAATSPKGETPTLPAIVGTIDYAVDQQALTTSDRTAIVLVTDGEPAGCESSVKNVSTECQKVLQSKAIPTYVIGVGDNIPGLDEIATGGGTTSAVIVSVGDPAKTSADFQKALESIRGSTLSCAFDIPKLDPTTDPVIDFAKVNVAYTPSSGVKGTVPSSPDCSFGGGWRYDNPSAPTRVELCPSLCDQVRNDEAGKIEIVFGCATIIY